MTLRRANPSTRARLLAEGERLFAERGIDGASVRAITQAAGVNLAAIHYHFESKEGLLREVLRSRIEPINSERIARLGELEQSDSRSGPEYLRSVLHAFIAPALEHLDGQGRWFLGLMAQIHHSSHPVATDCLRQAMGPVAKRFINALQMALPDLPANQLHLRLHFMIGAMLHNLASRDSENGLASLAPIHFSREDLMHELVEFCHAGFCRPVCARRGH